MSCGLVSVHMPELLVVPVGKQSVATVGAVVATSAAFGVTMTNPTAPAKVSAAKPARTTLPAIEKTLYRPTSTSVQKQHTSKLVPEPSNR